MNTNGVYVFHGTNGKHVTLAIADNFKLDFFPTSDIFFDKHLRNRRKHKPVMRNQTEFFFVIRNATACTAQRVRRTNDNGITKLICNRDTFFHRVSDIGRNARLIDFFHRSLEQFSIFRTVDCVKLRTDKFYAVFV